MEPTLRQREAIVLLEEALEGKNVGEQRAYLEGFLHSGVYISHRVEYNDDNAQKTMRETTFYDDGAGLYPTPPAFTEFLVEKLDKVGMCDEARKIMELYKGKLESHRSMAETLALLKKQR